MGTRTTHKPRRKPQPPKPLPRRDVITGEPRLIFEGPMPPDLRKALEAAVAVLRDRKREGVEAAFREVEHVGNQAGAVAPDMAQLLKALDQSIMQNADLTGAIESVVEALGAKPLSDEVDHAKIPPQPAGEPTRLQALGIAVSYLDAVNDRLGVAVERLRRAI